MSSSAAAPLLPSAPSAEVSAFMSRSKTPSCNKTIKMIALAFVALAGLGLAFLARYQFNEGWSSTHTFVPLAGGSLALIFFVAKTYKQVRGLKWNYQEVSEGGKPWLRHEWISSEVDGFTDTLICKKHSTNDITLIQTDGSNYSHPIEGAKHIEKIQALSGHYPNSGKKIDKIIQHGLFSCFTDKALKILNEGGLVPLAGAIDRDVNICNFIENQHGAFVEIISKKIVVQSQNNRAEGEQTVRTLVDITNDRAICTITITRTK